MQISAPDPVTQRYSPEGQSMAILSESLYIANLLLIPLLGFIILAIIFIRNHDSAPVLARSHLEQTVSASIWIGLIFFIAALTVMMLNLVGVEDLTIWMTVIIVFTLFHASMVLLGIIGLSKALSGKCWSYPVVGKSLPEDCHQ